MNQTKCQKKTFLETEEQPTPVTASHTNTPQNKIEKREIKEVSPSVIEVSSKDFQVYRKRANTNHAPDLPKEGERHSTIVMEGPNSSSFLDS
jgi:hypothetical protein